MDDMNDLANKFMKEDGNREELFDEAQSKAKSLDDPKLVSLYYVLS